MAISDGTYDIEQVLSRVEKELRGRPRAKRLRAIRDELDSEHFLEELKKLLTRRDNDPSLPSLRDKIARMARHAEELRDKRETERGITHQLALGGGGTTLVFGGVLVLLNPAIGMFALIPILGGIAVAIGASLGISQLDAEKSIYKQIADRLAEIRKEASKK